ncbi:MAG: Pycsar system effector family protein [Acidobacteriota bacterium]
MSDEAGQRFTDVRGRSSVDIILRTIQQHHVQLSVMADTKASILITISSIVLTIALSRSENPALRPALLTIAVSSLISLLLAIIAVLPTFTRRKNTAPNLFFFGHFASMSEAEFMDRMERTLATDDALYTAAARDIHGLGVYLYRKKYRFLRLAYVALLSGFVIATAVQAWVVWR